MPWPWDPTKPPLSTLTAPARRAPSHLPHTRAPDALVLTPSPVRASLGEVRTTVSRFPPAGAWAVRGLAVRPGPHRTPQAKGCTCLSLMWRVRPGALRTCHEWAHLSLRRARVLSVDWLQETYSGGSRNGLPHLKGSSTLSAALFPPHCS